MKHMKIDFENTHPEKILTAGFLEDYNRSINAIWSQLILFSSKVLALEKIVSFRFDLLDDNYPSFFWNLVIDSLYETTILSIWRVAIDNSNNQGITLDKLKSKIFKNFIDTQIKNQFSDKLKSLDYDTKVEETNKKITELRNNYISHFNYEKLKLSRSNLNLPKIYIVELKDAQRKIVEYFDILCFGEMKSVYPPDYDPEVIHHAEYDKRLDIEKILDNIAKDSYYVKGDETIPELWKMRVNDLSNEDLKVINSYRKKFDRPDLLKIP